MLDVLDATVRAHPDVVAIDDGETVLTYQELARETRLASFRLRAAGIGVGDRVGVRVPSGTADVYLAILAVLASGAAYVPVDVDDPGERAEMVWEQAGVCAVLEADQLLQARDNARGEPRRPTPDDDAWIIFTSGTTGRPKGVAVTHRSAAAFVDAEARIFLSEQPLGPDDRVLAGFSVAFDASCEEMWLAWRNGACLVPAPRVLVRAGVDLCPWLVERGITVVSAVPTLAAQWPVDGLPGVRLLILGGEACPPELAERFLRADREVWNTYGPTETTVVACAWRIVPGDTVRIGFPLDGWQLAVVEDDGAPVRWGDVGELAIGGVGLARYLDPANDTGRFTDVPELGRAYRSGDLVRADREGLVFVGRKDDQVKIRGHRIEPAAISAVLTEHPAVRQAHVRADDRLVAYVVLGGDAETLDLRRHLGASLPAVMVPDVFVRLDAMPVTTSGKIDVRALPRPAAATPPMVIGEVETTEDLIVSVWRAVLGVHEVGWDDSFFDLGGHSVLVAQVRDRLTAETGRTIPAVAMFDHPTVRALAAYLRDPDVESTPAARVSTRDRLRDRRGRLTK
ncbi:hypothetical protein ALI144C_09910 [Actinosynnema sp. ALI-1.44]|nr:hypothetical protein ALI144C_09910 [Actinosynnema sp. ALI-1.44]